MLAMAGYGPDDWRPPIIATSASTGDGIGDLAAAVDKHGGWLASSGQLRDRRKARARGEISAIAIGELQRRADGLPGQSRLDELAERVCAGKLDPYTAADELIVVSREGS
jgi:LAO/AO transport system kinase